MKRKRRRSTSQAINSIVSAAVSPEDIENLNNISDGGTSHKRLLYAALVILLRDDVRYAALAEITMAMLKGKWSSDRKVQLLADVMAQMGMNSKMDDVARLAS